MKLPLSVFIIAQDEEKRIADAIEAVQPWADEIIVVDSGSTDSTREIASALGAHVYQHDWTGYGPQKRYAEGLCRNRWVLNVDADEVVTPNLACEIQWLFRHGTPRPAAYKVRILNVYPGDESPRWLANDYNVVRLYHLEVGTYRDHPVYDRVETRGHKTLQLRSPVYHYTHLSITHAVEKAMRFSSFRAKEGSRSSRTLLYARLIVEFPVAFLKSYIGRRHITGGWKGFYFSVVQAFMRLTRIARMLELGGAR